MRMCWSLLILFIKPLPADSVFSQFLTVLRAELIRTFAALQRQVRHFPETFRIHHHTQLPDHPGRKCHQQQRPGVESRYECQRNKHHQVIPVEDPASRTAAVAHDKSERAPDQHADQITYIEKYGDQENNMGRKLILNSFCDPRLICL